MADGSFNPEIDAGVGKVSEVTKEQVEQFQEQLAAAQAALAALQKEEGQAKKKDFALAGLLNQFLQDNKDTEVLKLVIKCLEMNVPVNVIVAILSLAYVAIYNQLAEELKKAPMMEIPRSEKELLTDIEKAEGELSTKRTFDTQTLPPEVKSRINEWVKDTIMLSLMSKEKVLQTVYMEGSVKKTPLALSCEILRRYLETVDIAGDEEKVRSFAAFVLNGIGKELSK